MKLPKITTPKLKNTSITEIIVLLLVLVGLPSIAYIYTDIRGGYTAFIVIAIVVSFLKLKYDG